VGQGDAAVLRFPDNRVWVLDAGGRRRGSEPGGSPGLDIGEAVVSRFLWHLGLTGIDRLLLSHPHQDHAGGMTALMRNFSTSRLSYSETRQVEILTKILQSARTECVAAGPMFAGERARLGEVEVEILHPPREHRAASLNDNSMVMKLEYGRFAALFAGDLEGPGESALIARNSDLRCTLLKVAHHGSRSGTGDAFLQRAHPRWAVISSSSAPSVESIRRLVRHGATPLVTADHGAIFFETDGTRFLVTSYVSGLMARGDLP
jgi:competence protein ComEC